MKIDFNETECKALEAFLRNDSDLGRSLQAEFLAELKQSMRNGEDHCPCPAECNIHGKCIICVQVHRGHGNHLPHCMHLMLNKKLASLSELSEHSIVKNVEIPDYLNEQ